MNAHSPRPPKNDFPKIAISCYERCIESGESWFQYDGYLEDDIKQTLQGILNRILVETHPDESFIIHKGGNTGYFFDLHLKDGGRLVRDFSEKWLTCIKTLFPNIERVHARYFFNYYNSLHLSIGGTDDTNDTVRKINNDKWWSRSLTYREIINIKRKDREQLGYESKIIYDLVGEYMNFYTKNRDEAYKMSAQRE